MHYWGWIKIIKYREIPKQVINKKYYAPWQESGKTLEAYYNEDVLPDRLEEELQTAQEAK